MKISKHCVACGSKEIRRSPAILMPFMAARIFGWEPADVTEAWGMRDLKPGTAYSVCSSMMCDDCGMLFLDMRFDGEEMGALYDDYRGEAYSRLRDRFEPGYAARNAILLDGSPYLRTVEAFLASHVPVRPRVLDWGGDSGVNTPFRETAALHHIYDISGRPVIDGAEIVALADIRGDDYDLIVFANVLEHVANPREAMAEIAAAMTPSTTLYVEVPHEDVVRLIEAPADRLERKKHWHEHINFFTTQALDALFADVGLRTVERISHQVSAGGKDSHVFSIVARKLMATTEG